MAALTSRITLQRHDAEEEGPEDFLSTSLGVIFPDDITNNHGDNEHSLVYTSPYLPKPLHLKVCEPGGEEERRLFSHHLWNASLLLAELMERDSTIADRGQRSNGHKESNGLEEPRHEESNGLEQAKYEESKQEESKGKRQFDIRGLSTLELGAGTALPTIMASLLGASRAVASDYDSPAVLATLRDNLTRNAPLAETAAHSWGALEDEFAGSNRGTFDRVLVADCLWMLWQHGNLRRTIGHFLKRDAAARAWVVAGFHTGRETVAGFFDEEKLASEGGVCVESMWEVDCFGVERGWDATRGDGVTERKRWLVVAVLRVLNGTESAL